MLGNKTILKFKRIKIMSSIFSNHTGMKLEINYVKKLKIFTHRWTKTNMLLNNPRLKK